MRKRNIIYFDKNGKVTNVFSKEEVKNERESESDEDIAYPEKCLSIDEIEELIRKRHKDIDEEAVIMRALREGNGDIYGF